MAISIASHVWLYSSGHKITHDLSFLWHDAYHTKDVMNKYFNISKRFGVIITYVNHKAWFWKWQHINLRIGIRQKLVCWWNGHARCLISNDNHIFCEINFHLNHMCRINRIFDILCGYSTYWSFMSRRLFLSLYQLRLSYFYFPMVIKLIIIWFILHINILLFSKPNFFNKWFFNWLSKAQSTPTMFLDP